MFQPHSFVKSTQQGGDGGLCSIIQTEEKVVRNSFQNNVSTSYIVPATLKKRYNRDRVTDRFLALLQVSVCLYLNSL